MRVSVGNFCEKRSRSDWRFVSSFKLLNLVGSSGELPIDCSQRGPAEKKKRRGDAVLCFEVYVLIAENRTKRKTAQCSVPWQRHRQPNATKATTLRVQRISRALGFFVGKATHVSYTVHSLEDVLVCVLCTSPKSRGRWKKKKSQDNKKEKPQ